MYHILIVDEEEHLLWALERNLFPGREDIKVHTADSGEEGLEVLERESIDLLISDIKMPGQVDGFQLILRAKEKVPDARVMIITAFGTHRIQNFAERIGISHYIEKPFTVDELRNAILEILDEKEGFQGVLSDLELTDIIQMLCLAKRTALLHLKHRDHRGRIVFESGEVVHAEFDGTVGAEAVYEMLDLRQGDIFMQSDFDSTERTIDIGWQDLLLEGVKRADEQRLKEEQERTRKKRQEKRQKEQSQDSSASEKRTKTPIGMGAPSVMDDAGDDESASSGAMLFSEKELQEISKASEAALEESSTEEVVEAPELEQSATCETEELFAAEPDTTREAEAAGFRAVEETGPTKIGAGETTEEVASGEVDASSPQDSGSFLKTETEFQGMGVLESPAQDGQSIGGAVTDEHRAPGTALDGEHTSSSVEQVAAPEEKEKKRKRKRSGTSPGMAAVASEAMSRSEAGEESEVFAAPALNGQAGAMNSVEESDLDAPDPLREFISECPGLKATALIDVDTAEPIQWVSLVTDGDGEEGKAASSVVNLVSRAQRSVATLHRGDQLRELQLVLADEYLIMRSVEGAKLIHVALVDREVSLGVALVLMRQFSYGQNKDHK